MMRVRFSLFAVLFAALAATSAATAQDMTALSCDDFRPTREAIERFPNLVGACEGIVERDGELFGLFRATVRRVRGSTITFYLPATDRTFSTRPDPSMRVLINGRKTRPRDLTRGDEINVYLNVQAFSRPNIRQIALVTEQDMIVNVTVEDVPSLPRTASPLPMILAGGLFLLGVGVLLRRRRLAATLPLAVLLAVGAGGLAPDADAQESREIDIPARVVTSTVSTGAIVEAIDKETREIKLIGADGERYSITASDAVRNFDQIEPRDRIMVEFLESVAIFVVPPGMAELPDAIAVELAPLGDKPGIVAADTFMIKATIEELQMWDRTAVLRTESGELRKVKVSDDVAIGKLNIGDEVRLRVTEAMAVSVRKAEDS